jgi:bleomycin hydrolase
MLQIVKWIVILLLTTLSLLAQEPFSNKPGSQYEFKILKDLGATPVENQARTGTCWSFSSLSFFESEIKRVTGKEVDLSEMYVVRNAYVGKAENYLRMNGKANFAQGGAFHDIPWVWERYGMVPEYVYMGLNYGYDAHNHDEMEAALHGMVESFNKKPQGGKLLPNWKKAFTEVVDAYLGDLPDDLHNYTFKDIDGKSYTPYTYAKTLGIHPEDYVSLTSFTHHPFYSTFVIEVPDNWAMRQSYNLPIDDLMEVMEHALMHGYTFAWGADVSEKGFSARDALAILPEDDSTIQEKGKDEPYLNAPGKEKISNAFMMPVKEKWVTQEERQAAFDEQTTTDDHGMHATGIIQDQKGTKYLIIKNSWGTEHNARGGYFYASYPYVRYKTLNIQIHKDAIPKGIKKKLNLE